MKVEIDTESKKWLEAKGNQLTIKNLDIKACCAPSVQEIVAIPGIPKPIHQYTEYKVDNLSIYMQKSLGKKEKLTLKLSGFSFLKSISAKLQ